MPSNQYKPLVKPRYGNASSPFGGPPKNSKITKFLQIPNLVPRCYRALTIISTLMISLSTIASMSQFSSILQDRSLSSDPSSICDPFLLPGYLAQLPSGLATYRSYDPSCNVKGYLPALLSKLTSSPYHLTALSPSHIVSDSILQTKLTNKTVLLIGDETDHFLLQHFCTMVGKSVVDIDKHHPWGTTFSNVPKEHVRKVTDPNSFINSDPGQKALAHYCHIPEYDFLLVSTYHLGGDIGDTFQGKPAWTAPGLFENRLEDLYIPMMNSMSQQFDSTSISLPPKRSQSWPDAVILSTSFWDLARYAFEDNTMMRSLVDDLSEHRLLSWRSRYVDMLTMIQKTWKEAKVGWRSLHLPPDAEETTLEWWIGTQTDSTKTSNDHPLFHTNRITALNAARKSVIYPTGDDIVKGRRDRSARLEKGSVIDFDWGTLMIGQDHHQVDRLHPGLTPGGTLFGEMLIQQML